MIDFDEQLSLCHQSDADVADFLELLGDHDAARALREAGARGQGLSGFMSPPWRQATHVYGFIEEGRNDGKPIRIAPAVESEPDGSLVGQQIKVTLDAFRIHDYPGFGRHTVLFDFAGRDQAGPEAQDLQFASVLSAGDGEAAAVSGLPIFTGLTVPRDGLSFKARTVLIGNTGDDVILEVLQSSAFKDGLKLLGMVQPALPQLVAMAGGIARNLMKRPRNKQIQLFDLGLDFSDGRTSARLRRGSYVVVQVPGTSTWRWADWALDPSTMTLIDADGRAAPHNMIVFAVSSSAAGTASSSSRSDGRKALKTVAKRL